MAPHTKRRIVTAAVAAACYALLWTAVALHWKWLNSIDSAILAPLHSYGVKRPGWVRFWNVFATVFGPEAFRLVGAVVVVVEALRRDLRAVLLVLTVIE